MGIVRALDEMVRVRASNLHCHLPQVVTGS